MPSHLRTRSELDVLAAIERDEVVTQMALTKRIGISIGLVNGLLKRSIRKGFVKVRQAPSKRYAYYLTPSGFAEKSRLVAEYLEFSLQFYRTARREYAEIMVAARQRGMRRLVLVGRGELTEIAVLAAWGEGIELQAVLDWQANEDRICGLKVVRSLDEVGQIEAAVITESRRPQEVYDELRQRLPEAQVLVPLLLKVVRDSGHPPSGDPGVVASDGLAGNLP
jgi:DNA-binding MarR family transcriptional regulator